MKKEIKDYNKAKAKFVSEMYDCLKYYDYWKYSIYKLKDGKKYLSVGCPCCSKDCIELTDKEVDLIKKARENR